MSVAVDARFAGGSILVDVDEHAGAPVVIVQMPGDSAAMFPDEARRLAVTLIEQAARAENPPEADTWP
ncbi:hypothetical protein [Microbacterium sp. Leaf151]|uniref:hypothetical protein n=1 Tax=Microbacterium sp. Leaf151 TaxID=1736276 RepID=UPI0006F8D7B7|nr:hypothetical protein [Microbacterium sp. Leaf151]KQR23179.1 hypothetical protein ASF76_08105 [Microbacterium sp. Leaf151]